MIPRLSRPIRRVPAVLVAARAVLLATTLAACSGGTSPDARVLRVVVDPPELELSTGSSVPLAAVVRDTDGDVVATPPLFWASSDTTVAVVSPTGVVSGRKLGVARVVASVPGDDADVTVRVVASPVAAVAVSPTAATVLVGATQQLTAAARDGAGVARPDRPVAWRSQNEAVATVSAFTGVVTGVAPGTATILATVDGQTGSATITVGGTPGNPPGTAPGPSNDLVADFTFGCANLICAFTDVSTGGGASVKGWLWEFGDGQTSPFRHSDNPYPRAGTYTVKLTATTDRGTAATVTKTVTVAANQTTRQLVNRATGACLSMEFGSTDRGALFATRACDGGADQQFAVPTGTGVGPLQLPRLNDRFAQVDTLRDGVVNLWSWHGGYTQRWSYTASSQLRSFVTNTCLTAPPGTSRYVALAVCADVPAQRWESR